MKRAFLIHGWNGYPEEGWRPWLKKKLEEKDFAVFALAMPDTVNPKEEKWVRHLEETVKIPDTNCYFIGHSLGCITILRYLETLHVHERIGGTIFVAGFGKDLSYKGYNKELKGFFTKPVNWEKIKKHCRKFVAINSTNDTWVSLLNNKLFVEKLGAEGIIMDNMKHFSGDDGIVELPIVLEKILAMANEY